MIEISVNGQLLDMAENASVSFVMNNTLFDADVLQGSYSYPFTVPASARNRIIFGFPEVIENLASLDTEFDCVFRYELLAISARLKIRDIKPDSYSVNLFTQVGAVGEKLKTTKLNELPLERIDNSDARPYMNMHFVETGAGPIIGQVIDFKVFRQDGSQVWHSIPWRGSISFFLTDLVAKINGKYNVPAFNLASTYNRFHLVKDGLGNIWECQYDNQTGEPLEDPPVFSMGTPYAAGKIVDDGFANYYKALQSALGVDLSDPDFWVSVPTPYWILYAYAVDWPSQYRAGTTPLYYLYDDPADTYKVEAVGSSPFLTLFDGATGGSSPLDYMLIWSQSWSGLQVVDGVQSVDGSSSPETRFTYFINLMFQKVVESSWPACNYAFFPVYNPTPFNATDFVSGGTVRPYINYYAQDEFKFSLSSLNHAFFTPYPYVGHVLEQLFLALGVKLTADVFEGNPDLQRLVIYNNTAAVKVVREAFVQKYLVLPFEIKLQNHVPALALGDFINALRGFFFWGFLFDIEAQECRVVFLKDILQAPYAKDFTAAAESDPKLIRDNPGGFTLSYTHDGGDQFIGQNLPDISKYTIEEPVATAGALPASPTDMDQLRLVMDEDAYYRPLWNTDNTSSWAFFARNLYPYKVGEGKTTKAVKMAPLLSSRQLDQVAADDYGVAGRNWLTPMASQKLTIRDLQVESSFTLRLMYYWGLQPDSQGNDYPFGSSGNVNFDGDVLGTPALRFDGVHGTYELYGKEWLAFLQSTKRVTRNIWLTSLQLKNLSQADKIRIEGVDFLWRSCKLTFPITKPAEFELWHVS